MNKQTEEIIKLVSAKSYKRGFDDGYAKAKQDLSSHDVYKFNCEVCFLPVDDMEEHYIRFQNEAQHKTYIDNLRASDWKLPCFCGGHITIFNTSVAGTDEAGWEIVCDNCKMLLDED